MNFLNFISPIKKSHRLLPLQKDYINGGFYILNKEVLGMESLTRDASCSFERQVLEELILKKERQAFRFDGYWQSLDTERDLEIIRQFIKKH